MFNYLCESGRSYPIPSLTAMTISAAANVAVLAAAVVVTRPPAVPVDPAEITTSEVVYLLPLPPQRTEFEEVGVHWSGGDIPGAGPFLADSSGAGLLTAGKGEDSKGAGARGARDRERPALDTTIQFGEFDGSNYYIASELDHPVSFDPTSAGPVYPPELQRAGIEGWATIQFIVDSTGLADVRSIKEIEVTHPGFAAAVREALPKMHFRPAELGERRVSQLVEQQFKFVIQMAAMVPPADSQPSP